MAINRWRCVGYTDDGCCDYACLACGKGWEGRSNPEWCGWNFCPHCGTRWEGRQADRSEARKERKYRASYRSYEIARARMITWDIESRSTWISDGEVTSDWSPIRSVQHEGLGGWRKAWDAFHYTVATEQGSDWTRIDLRLVARFPDGRRLVTGLARTAATRVPWKPNLEEDDE